MITHKLKFVYRYTPSHVCILMVIVLPNIIEDVTSLWQYYQINIHAT